MPLQLIIPPTDESAMKNAQAHLDRLVKPVGALGQLESLAVRLVGMTGNIRWFPQRKAVLVFAGDHGVMVHQVSTVPQSITAYMVDRFLAGQAGISVLARQMQARLTVIDAGVNADFKPRMQLLTPNPTERLVQPVFIQRKIAHGTADFTRQPAMTEAQAVMALQLGAEVMLDEIRQGLDIAVLGEMGIGNTTSASAIISALCDVPAAQVTGRGTGIDDAAYTRKVALITEALQFHQPEGVAVLAAVGGFEIGAMAGAMLAAASQRVPVIIDGVICTAAALIAQAVNPAVKHYLIAGHLSPEPGHRIALDKLGLAPLLALDMRLGEGSGAVLALPLIEASIRTLNEMGLLSL